MKNGDWRINKSRSQTPEHRRALYYNLRDKVFSLLGNKCNSCGFEDVRALQIDHVHSDGAKDRKKSGTSYLYHVLNTVSEDKYQLLCANCNWIKRHTHEEVKKIYEEGFSFPTEPPHIKVFKEKQCHQCKTLYVPTNGRQKYCNNCKQK